MYNLFVLVVSGISAFWLTLVLFTLCIGSFRHYLIVSKRRIHILYDVAILFEYRRAWKVEAEYSKLNSNVSETIIKISLEMISLKFNVNPPILSYDNLLEDFSGWYRRDTKQLGVCDGSLIVLCHEMTHHILNERNIKDHNHGKAFVSQLREVCEYMKEVLS